MASVRAVVVHEGASMAAEFELTDEMVVSHALKRLTMIGQTLGDADHHLLRFAALSDVPQAA